MNFTSLARPLACLALIVGAACARSDNGDVATTDSADSAAPTPPASDTAPPAADAPWTTLKTETVSTGYSLAADGTVSWRGRPLTPPLMLRDQGDAGSAITYRVSPTSPSGRWALADGRSSTFGRVYVLDLEQGATRAAPATKYGIIPWVVWAAKLPYAIVSTRVEGTALLYRIDLTSGEARQIDFSSAARAPLSATPLASTLRWLDDEGRAFLIGARVACNSAVERCEGAPAEATRRFRVDTRTLQVTAA